MPPCSTTSDAAAPTVRPEPQTFAIRYAAGDADVVAIHQFLLDVARPAMRCPVDHANSAREVWRVVNQEVALMAFVGERLVASLGIINPTWWYGNGKDGFLADRWDFTHPDFQHSGVHEALLEEAVKIANTAGLEFIHQGKLRERKIRGMHMMMPRILAAESATTEN